MVQFGRHIDVFVAQDNSGTGLYVVPYNDVKVLCATCDDDSPQDFERKWRETLEHAARDFENVVSEFWSTVFGTIASHEEARGALPGVAISLYLSIAGKEATQELLVKLKHIHQAAYHNTEALRKLVKKFDKKHSIVVSSPHNNHATKRMELLGPRLLPLVYSANFTIGQLTLEEGIALFQDVLLNNNSNNGMDELPSDGSVGSNESDRSYHESMIEDRAAEMEWLQHVAQSMDEDELSRLVAHRGFHSIRDYTNRRPIENSLAAYETAWTSGIHLCECDIALTKDEKLILGHDADFSRLALNKKNPISSKKIQDLTFKELMALPLTSQARPPLLIDVLQSAHHIGDNAQLIIEIKPGNEAAATALARLLARYPELIPCVAVIMSFDVYIMHKLRQELVVLSQTLCTSSEATNYHPLLNHHRTRSRSRSLSFSSGLNILDFPSNGQPAHSIVTSTGFTPLSTLRKHGSEANVSGIPRPPSSTYIIANQEVESGIPRLSSKAHMSSSPSSGSENCIPRPSSKNNFSPIAGSSLNTPAPPCIPGMPKLMMLTVADPPKRPADLRVSIDNLSKVDSWAHCGNGEYLDGVYLQFQKEMLEPPGLTNLQVLSEKYTVGVWLMSGVDPDNYKTFCKLVHEAKVAFVNTDLPFNFRDGIVRKSSRLLAK
jgi:glycerophosphoryl diester phosphodiesterase